MTTAIALLVASATLVGSGAAQDEPPQTFQRHRLALETELAETLVFDADGDGNRELAVIEADRGKGRTVPYTLQVYRQSEGGFALLPSASQQLPDEVMLPGIGTFRDGGRPTPGLVLLMPGEVQVWPWRGDRFDSTAALRLPVESIFPVSDGRMKRDMEWIFDMDGDGISEIVVPGFDRLTVVRQHASGLLLPHGVLDLPARTRLRQYFRRGHISFELPYTTLMDVDGRGWQDVLVYIDGLLRIFLLDDQSAVERKSPWMEVDFQPPKPFDPKEPYDPPLLMITAEDLNADGLPDLVFSKTTAADSEINSRTTVLVHYGRTGTDLPVAFSRQADQVFPSAGLTLPFFLDANHDGRTDLIMVNVQIGFWNVIKALITRSVNADAAFYPMPPDGRYAAQPAEQETYGITFSLNRFGHQPITAFGDLNADGLPDLLLSSDTNRIGIHWGRTEGIWDDDPDAEWEDFMPLNGSRVRVEDINGDKREDLIFLYNREDIRKMPELGNSVAVLLSRFPRRDVPVPVGGKVATTRRGERSP